VSRHCVLAPVCPDQHHQHRYLLRRRPRASHPEAQVQRSNTLNNLRRGGGVLKQWLATDRPPAVHEMGNTCSEICGSPGSAPSLQKGSMFHCIPRRLRYFLARLPPPHHLSSLPCLETFVIKIHAPVFVAAVAARGRHLSVRLTASGCNTYWHPGRGVEGQFQWRCDDWESVRRTSSAPMFRLGAEESQFSSARVQASQLPTLSLRQDQLDPPQAAGINGWGCACSAAARMLLAQRTMLEIIQWTR
jgi:hypothetical protein